tara:strand:+ start:141 stop:749 length:609 start_codon:yes stop_codon:yes gene_type:complete
MNKNMRTRSQAKKYQRLIFWDLETSGLNQYHDEIIEIGAIDDAGNKFQILIKPEREISEKITKITGITNPELEQKGVPLVQALQEFINFCEKETYDNLYLIAHNGRGFDDLFLKRDLKKLDLTFPSCNYLDTLLLSKLVLPDRYSYRLGALCSHWNIQQINSHRADDDAYCLSKVYMIMTSIMLEKFPSNEPSYIMEKLCLN